MHKRFTAAPHDLRAVCFMFGKTISILSERTGIPEEELLGFANGTHALSASDRFAIIREFVEWSSPVLPHGVGTPSHRLALEAYRLLIREVEDEERAADEELDMPNDEVH